MYSGYKVVSTMEYRLPAARIRSRVIGSAAPSGPVNEGMPAQVPSSLTSSRDVVRLLIGSMYHMDDVWCAHSGHGEGYVPPISILSYGDGNVSTAVSGARGGRRWAS